jgi:ElaB/YqjD/DUF883 family membrane-anchored ribosome-binding protein
MADNTLSSAFKDATEKLHDRVVALGDETGRRVRENAPRVRRAVVDGYEDGIETVRDLAGNRSVQGMVAAGVLGLVVGFLMSSSRR